MAQNDVWLLIGLFVAAIPLIWLARRANIPYPIVLVLGGLVLGFVPWLPRVELDPNLVLIIFLPPLLYWESVTAPTDVMRANAGQIWLLAIGLVTATTIAVAAVVHLAIPNFSWALAFVLGAIVAPTDELASAPILERMRMPRHLIAIVEGESLLNDASALLLYAVAIQVAVTGVFHLAEGIERFLIAVFGGIALGLGIGRLAVIGWRRITDVQLQGVISVVTPFLAYSLAQRLELSGVLAVVFTGIVVNRYSSEVITSQTRVQGVGFWESVVFLANALLFLLVGLQLHEVGQYVLAEYSWQTLLWWALLVNVTVIGTRFAWVMIQEFAPVIGGSSEHPEGDWKHAFITAWSGFRGAVSLAAALALPVVIASGATLPRRHLIIFLTFTVILVTLVGGGLLLPRIIRWLGVDADTSEEDEDTRRAIVGMSQAALKRLDEIEKSREIPSDEALRLRRRYEHKRDHADGHPEEEAAVVAVERELLKAERDALIVMRARGELDNTTQRRMQRVLDIAFERLRQHG